MTRTIIPAQPNETVIEIWREEGVMRRRPHRVIAWLIDENGNPGPIGAMGPFDDRKARAFFYQQPSGGVVALDGTDFYLRSIEDAVDMIANIMDAADIAETRAHWRSEPEAPSQPAWARGIRTASSNRPMPSGAAL